MTVVAQSPARVTWLWHVSDAAPHCRLVASVYFLVKALRKGRELTNGAVATMLCGAFAPTFPISFCDEIMTVLQQCNEHKLLFKDILPVLCSPMTHAKTGTRYTATPFCHTMIIAGLNLGKSSPATEDTYVSGPSAYATAMMLMKRANLIPDFSACYQNEKSIGHVNDSSYDLDVYECRRGWRETSLLLTLRQHTAPMRTNEELLQLYDAVSGGGTCSTASAQRLTAAIYPAVVITHVFYFSKRSMQPIASFLLTLVNNHN